MTDDLDDLVRDLLARPDLARVTAGLTRLVAVLPPELRAAAAVALRDPVSPANASAPVVLAPRVGIPALALRDLVVFPAAAGSLAPSILFIGRASSVAAIEAAVAHQCPLLMITQRRTHDANPTPADLFPVGNLATVTTVIRLGDLIKASFTRGPRVRIQSFVATSPHFSVEVDPLAGRAPDAQTDGRIVAVRAALAAHAKSIKRGTTKKAFTALLQCLKTLDDPQAIVDTLGECIPDLTIDDRQALLELEGINEQLEHLELLLRRLTPPTTPKKPKP